MFCRAFADRMHRSSLSTSTELQIKISAMSDLMLKAARTIAYKETGSAGPRRAA